MPDQHWVLKQCRLLERLPTPELVALEQGCRFRRFAAGRSIYLPADQADAVLVLYSGRVKICHTNHDGKQSILAFVDPGELFGELCLFDGRAREELAIAIESSEVVLIPRDVMKALMERQPALALGISRLIGLRRLRIERRLKNLLYCSNRERLVHLLLELVDNYGEHTPNGIRIGVKLSHQDLASIIGSTRETVTATLGDLQGKDLVRLARQRIVVCSKEKLAASLEVMATPGKS